MGRKVTAFVTVGALVLATAAIAKSTELEGDFGEAHPDSKVTAKVRLQGGVPTEVKTFEFSGLLVECADGSKLEVSGELGRPAEVVEKRDRFKFEAELNDGGSTAAVRGRVSRSGGSLEGALDYESQGGDCTVSSRLKLRD